jgi:RNA polymerase sigma-70 factor (ECF subfamily)
MPDRLCLDGDGDRFGGVGHTFIVRRGGVIICKRHIDAVLAHGDMANYSLAQSARADMYRRLGRAAEARSSYEKALALTQQEPELQFLRERVRQLK